MPPTGRALLHQPFFPLYSSSPPTQLPPLPSPPSSFPKYPSSSSSTSNSLPFFPLYPSPPPPRPSPSIPTFPANISTLITPSHYAPPSSSKLILIISLPILALLLLALSAAAAFFLIRRYRSSDCDLEDPGSDNHRLVPPNSTASDARKLTATSAQASSEFLYLGTLVNSRGHVDGGGGGGTSGQVNLCLAADSPELRPLPPLFRQARRSSSSEEDAFYSPPPSSPPARLNPPPPPPPPPPRSPAGLQPPVLAPPKVRQDSEQEGEKRQRPRLKALHWDKVRASSDRTMVWDHLKSSSFQLNEEMIETLFGCDGTNGKKETTGVKRKVDRASAMNENMVLNLKKAQNIAILLRALNVTTEEVCEALLEGNTDSLGNELLETLLKMAPSKEEEVKLREYRDDSPYKLGPAEKFLKAMLDIPFAFKRVDAMLYIANFDAEVSYLTKSFDTLELACEELRNSRLFRKLLDAVLKTGNRMNVGTNRGDAQAFKLDTLLKLVDIKGTDGKTSLLHFVVQEISRTEGFRQSTTNPQSNTLHDDLEYKRLGLHVVSGLGAELSNVKKAATIDSDILCSYLSKLAGGIARVREVVRLNEAANSFHESMTKFLKKAEGEISKLQNQEGVALSLVKEITEYFHGDSAKEEAHPLRIFMVVRDFLLILDQVCKDVGRLNERSVVSLMRQFPVTANTENLPVFPSIHGVQPGSSDDESSSLSSFSS